MSISLNCPTFQFTLNPDTGSWSLHGTQENKPFIEDAWMRVNYRTPISAIFRSGRRRHKSLDTWRNPQIHDPEVISSPHGKLQKITVKIGPDPNGIYFIIEYALARDHPIFIWRLTVDNRGKYPIEIEQLKMMQAGFFPKRKLLPNPGPLSTKYQSTPVGYGAVRPHPNPGELAFYSNGWQSWSYTGTLGSNEIYRGTKLGFITSPMWFNDGTPLPNEPGHFASDMFGVLGDRKHRTGILAGFLSQKQHFGSLEASTNPLYPALALWANGDQTQLYPGSQMSTDWAAIQFVNIDAPDPIAPYLKAVAREHNLRSSITNHQPFVGWCSWYQFYQDISQEKIRTNLQSAAETKTTLSFDLFQIDDGFEAQIGDWFDFSSGFPNGIASLAIDIQKSGFRPGLWLAPFIVHSKSQLKRKHPDWLLRNRFGRPVNTGFVWNNFNTAIDLTQPEALEYAKKIVHTATHDWGYKFLKLDFLYAAAVKGRYRDRTKTRAQVLRMGLEALREAAGPDVHLLGCAAPLGTSVGIFDSMRISADVDPRWMPSFLGIQFPFKNEYPMPSTRNAIQNTLTRSFLHQRWWINDPDCLLVRPDSDLTLAEVQSLATTIALTGGPLLLSDDLPQLPIKRRQIAEQLLPLIGQRPRMLDWFDTASPRLLRLDLENVSGKWHLLAIFNWDDDIQDLSIPIEKLALPVSQYFVREFWSGTIAKINEGVMTIKNIPPHGVRLLALRPVQAEQACYLGSDLHISQGLEVCHYSNETPNLNLRLERPGKAQGRIELYLPNPPSKVTVNQNEIEWQTLDKNIYRLHIQFIETANVDIC